MPNSCALRCGRRKSKQAAESRRPWTCRPATRSSGSSAVPRAACSRARAIASASSRAFPSPHRRSASDAGGRPNRLNTWDGIRECHRLRRRLPAGTAPAPGSRAGPDRRGLPPPSTSGHRRAPHDEALPVMVWFDGGSFVFRTAPRTSVSRRRGLCLQGRGAGDRRLSRRPVRLSHASRPHADIVAARPPPGNYAGLLDQIAALRLGAAEHRGVRRRPPARDRLWRLGGLGFYCDASHLAACGRALPTRHSRKPGRVPSAGEPRRSRARGDGPGATSTGCGRCRPKRCWRRPIFSFPRFAASRHRACCGRSATAG